MLHSLACVVLSLALVCEITVPAFGSLASTSQNSGDASGIVLQDEGGDATDPGNGGGTGDPDPDPNPGGTDPDPDPDPNPNPGGGEQPSNTAIGLYLFYSPVNDTSNPTPCTSLTDPPRIDAAKGSLQLLVQGENEAAGSGGWIHDMGLTVNWVIQEQRGEDGSIASKEIATIDRASGVLRATGQGNGTVKVKCWVITEGYTGEATTTITIYGNSEVPYVTKVEICDDSGTPYADDAEIRVSEDRYKLENKFYVQVTYMDAQTGTEVVKNTYNGDVIEGAAWNISANGDQAYVNPDTGTFIAYKTGTVRLTCAIAGSGQYGETLSDSVTILCGGEALDPDRDYSPADYLTVVVKYAAEDKGNYGSKEDYDKARTWYYTPSDLEALGATTNSYTLVKSDGSWDRLDAYGVYFASLIADQDLELNDVEGFYLQSTDPYNPGFIGCDWLFKQRYYYPNMSIGTGFSGAVGVAPMLALATLETPNGDGATDTQLGELSTQTRFRLCIGAEGTTINNAQKSVYNISTITIILEGAPPTQWETPTHGSSVNPGAGKNPNPEKPGGSEDPTDPTPEKPGDEPTNPQNPSENPPTSSVGNDTPTEPTDVTDQQANDAAESEQASEFQSSEGGGESSDSDAAESKRWQVYEMMRADDPKVEALDVANPLIGWAIAAVILFFLAGGGASYRYYRRETASIASGISG